jgi:hypothetical protein
MGRLSAHPERLRPHHEFWPNDVSITDRELFDPAFILGPGQIADVYLLGLAVKTSGGWSPSSRE